MVVPRPLKHRATVNLSPLQQAGILQHVLDYVGPGHWCFVAEVSSLWRDVCASDTRRELPLPQQYYARSVAYVPQMTVFSAVFTSPSCVRHAHAHGLDFATEWCERAAGRYGDIPTLQTAHELGMAYTDLAILGAAGCNQLGSRQGLSAAVRPSCIWRTVPERQHLQVSVTVVTATASTSVACVVYRIQLVLCSYCTVSACTESVYRKVK
jgi:hypothetical protein